MKLISAAAYALAAIALISGQSEARRKGGWVFTGRGRGGPQGGFTAGRGYDLSEDVGGRKGGWVFTGRGRGGPQGGFTAGRGYDLSEDVGGRKGGWVFTGRGR